MAWTYSGDPGSSETDKYRFLIGDTDEDEPVLTDEEINFVLSEHPSDDARLYQLFDKAAIYFARQIEFKIGPIEEKPIERLKFFQKKAQEYYKKVYGLTTAIPSVVCRPSSFKIGMHDG